MLEMLRPDTTEDGWNTWPTERVSYSMRDDPSVWRDVIRIHVASELQGSCADVAAVRLGRLMRTLVERAVKAGEAGQLQEDLLRFALSRVDWFQLAQMSIADALPDDQRSLLYAGY
jgi:hypothetical protein